MLSREQRILSDPGSGLTMLAAWLVLGLRLGSLWPHARSLSRFLLLVRACVGVAASHLQLGFLVVPS